MSQIRDIVVIGGSAGAVEGMLGVAERLPHGLRASIFLVIHVSPTARSLLPQLLERRGALRSWHPHDGERFVPSVIYVASPDHHLLVRVSDIGVQRGLPENGHRPAVDALFRSASAAHGARVLGVVLSGNLRDGAMGLRAIADAGGAAIVQDPRTADYPGMPASALALVPEAEVVPLDAIAGRIAALSGGGLADRPALRRGPELGAVDPLYPLGGPDAPRAMG